MNRPEPVPAESASPPWWKERMMWLVVGGPLLVVVAATVTAVIAIRGADVVLPQGEQRIGPGQAVSPETPAMQGRNHANTPPPAR